MKTAETKNSIGARIKAARKKRGMTQSQLAARISVTTPHVSKMESDVALPSVELAEALAQALELEDFVSQVESARLDSYRQHLLSRREIRRTRQSRSKRPSELERKAAAIANDLLGDAALEQAYYHLKNALANPNMRYTAMTAVEAFASYRNQSAHLRLSARHADVSRLRRHFIEHPIPLLLAEVSVTIEPNNDDIILHFQNSQFDLDGLTVTLYKVGASEGNEIKKPIEARDAMFALSELGLTIRQLDRVRFRVTFKDGSAVEGSLL